MTVLLLHQHMNVCCWIISQLQLGLKMILMQLIVNRKAKTETLSVDNKPLKLCVNLTKTLHTLVCCCTETVFFGGLMSGNNSALCEVRLQVVAPCDAL